MCFGIKSYKVIVIMQVERRVLYNSLRMNWLLDPSLKVEPWQVEDYRSLRLETLFERLKEKDLFLDRVSFLALAENVDTPENLTDDLLADADLSPSEQDQIYLLVFELWRRLIPEKLCLSIFCDELDNQIFLYDRGQLENIESLEDLLANLEVILDENTDEGGDPHEVFESICACCANDIENFLYDFIARQIDGQNYSYASELLDGFINYVKEIRWFEFLKARLLAVQDPQSANETIRQLLANAAKNPDLDFNLEILTFLVKGGEKDIFLKMVKRTLALLELEEDFQDLLSICADYYRLLDHDNEERAIQNILEKRSNNALEGVFNPGDAQVKELLQIIS